MGENLGGLELDSELLDTTQKHNSWKKYLNFIKIRIFCSMNFLLCDTVKRMKI